MVLQRFTPVDQSPIALVLMPLDWYPHTFRWTSGLVNFDGVFLVSDPKKISLTGIPLFSMDVLKSVSVVPDLLEEIGFDGLRVDAKSSMLYLNIRNEGMISTSMEGMTLRGRVLKDIAEMVKGLDQPHKAIAEELHRGHRFPPMRAALDLITNVWRYARPEIWSARPYTVNITMMS